MTLRAMIAGLMCVGAALGGEPAFAHAALIAATPPANVAAAKTRTVKLTYSERLMPKMSKATLIMTGMPGMSNHPEMKVPGISSSVSSDGKSIVLVSAHPLQAGSYRVDWVAVGFDTHRIAGKHLFTVR